MIGVSGFIHCFLPNSWWWSHQRIIFLVLLFLLVHFCLKHCLCIESQIFYFNRVLVRVELKLSNDRQDALRVLDIFLALETHALDLRKVRPNRHRASFGELGTCQGHYESDRFGLEKNVQQNIPVKLLNNWRACILQPGNIRKHETIPRVLMKVRNERLWNSRTMTDLKFSIWRSHLFIRHFNQFLNFLNRFPALLHHPRNSLQF